MVGISTVCPSCALPSTLQPACITITTTPNKLTFLTEPDFQAHLAVSEDEFNVDLLLDKCEQGSAVDTSAPGYVRDDPMTWRALPHLPRGNSTLSFRSFACHCHGVSRAQLPSTEGLSKQAEYTVKYIAAQDKGR